MKNAQGHTKARSVVDRMVCDRFKRSYDTDSLEAYLDHLDKVSTAHLSAHLKHQALAIAGQQRRAAKVFLDANDPAKPMIALAMDDPRREGAKLTATVEFGIWLDLMEAGAHGAWSFNTKGRPIGGQVVTRPPMRRSGLVDRVAIARLITNAKAGNQAKTLDHNPLNLRRANLFVLGNPDSGHQSVGTAKADARATVLKGKALQSRLAGSGFGFKEKGDE